MISKSTRVLLVEDLPVIAHVTEQMLAKAPSSRYTSVTVATLADTLSALADGDVDVLLLDLNLPDSRELETVKRVIAADPDVPVIVLTATNDSDLGRQAVQLGAQDYLPKGQFSFVMLDRAILFAIERHRLQRTLRQLAVIDDLTGLYNRRGFSTLHADFLQRVARSGRRGYLCYFDVDGLKQINDDFGHAAGDDALRDFAHTLQSAFRKDTLLVRLGGDEFAVLGTELREGGFDVLLASWHEMLTVRNTMHAAKPSLSASWGHVFFQGAGPFDINQLVAAADGALYRQKKEQKSRSSGAAASLAAR